MEGESDDNVEDTAPLSEVGEPSLSSEVKEPSLSPEGTTIRLMATNPGAKEAQKGKLKIASKSTADNPIASAPLTGLAKRDPAPGEQFSKFLTDDGRARSVLKSKAHDSGGQILAKRMKTEVGLFAGCSVAFLEELLANVEEIHHPQGEIIVEEEEHDESILILLDGSADVIVKERRVGRVSAGFVVGEATLQHFSKRLLTLQARKACRMLRVPASVLEKLLLGVNYGAERRFFVGRREAREAAADRLKKVPSFAQLKRACLQAAVLEADYIHLESESSWMPNEASRCKGQEFIVITEGHPSLQIEGYTAARLAPGYVVSSDIFRSSGTTIATETNSTCSFYCLSLHDLLAAVLYFPQCEEWFNNFREQQNARLHELKDGLASVRYRIAARAANPRDEDIQSWVASRKAAKRKARSKKNDKRLDGRVVKSAGGISLPFIEQPYGLNDDLAAYRVAVCSRA